MKFSQILRTLCYSTKLIGGLAKDDLLAKRFQVFSSQMSATRATLRLLDDLPMLKYTLEYGIGKEVRICVKICVLYFYYN